MNVKRFTARTARDALAAVRQAFGEDAVVLSTKPCLEGIEVVAMAPESLEQFERVAAAAPSVQAMPAYRAPAAAPRSAPVHYKDSAPRSAPVHYNDSTPQSAPVRHNEPAPSVAQDVGQLGMSTMSFQSYVRERMLKRREAALRDEASEALAKRARAASAAAARRLRAWRCARPKRRRRWLSLSPASPSLPPRWRRGTPKSRTSGQRSVRSRD